MALTIAMPLSGLEPEHFYALGARLLYDQGVKSLSGFGNSLGRPPAPISPSSGSETSSTSGISSLATSSGDTPTPTATPAESRPASPEDTKYFLNITRPLQWLLIKPPPPGPKIVYGSRDLLNLAANIRGPGWPILHPSLPRDNPTAFMANRSLYYRLGEHGLLEEYPSRCCGECHFCEPSPILSF